MNDILTVSGLNKSYGDFSLKDVTFSLPEGCITGFIGVNGAGKTTTLRTLLGLTNKLSGKIQFFGLDMDKNEREIKDRIGIVLDGGGFYEELSLGEMKVIISSAYTSWSEQDFKRYMDMFSLDPKQKINSLSKGMRMKYALALALSHNAELLIMDEPTSGLDPLVRGQLLKILTEYMENGGKGVFFSTHITSDLDKIADMLIMIDNGRIVFREEKDTLLDTYRIVKGDSGALTTDARKLFYLYRKLILDLQELQSKYPKYGLIFPTLWLSVRRLRILCLEISEVKNDVVRPTKKGFSDCKKICADYACSYCAYPTCHALADTGVYGSFWIYSFCHFWHFHTVAICIPKRVSISKSCDITMCHTIFTESNSFIKIHFLHGYICNLLYRF